LFREIPYFKDLRKLHSLSAQVLEHNSQLKAQLKERGAEFVKLQGRHYLEYHDSIIQKRSFGFKSKILRFRVSDSRLVKLIF